MKRIIIFFMLIALASCGGTKYQEFQNNNLSSTFGVNDQKKLVDDLVNKLITDGVLQSELKGSRPTLLIDIVKNKTSEQIDTESITDTIKFNIIKSRMFAIISRDKIDILAQEQSLVQSGISDSQRALQLGKIWGAQYVLYGNFSSIVNYVKNEKQVYYKLTLIIQNIETGEEIWIDESEINKITKR